MTGDIRHAYRVLARQPALTVTVVLSLAVGLGANAAMFSIVRGVLLRALPYENPDRVVDVRIGTYAEAPGAMFGWQFVRWRAGTGLMRPMAGYNVKSLSLAGDGHAELVTGAEVTADFFTVLGVVPYLGSTFREEHQRPGTRAAILSWRVWERRYGNDPNIVGGTVVIEGEPYTVLGVMPAGFSFPENAECWTILTMTEDGMKVARQPGGSVSVQPARLRGIGRLTPDATIEAVQLEGRRLLARPAVPVTALVVRLQDMLVGPVRQLLLVLQGAVLLLLTMVCANVTSLLLARGESRRQELAIRLALGASRWRLVRQALTESGLLVVAGAALSVAIAAWLTAAFKTLAPPEVPRLNEVELDGVVLAFIVGLSGLIALGCGALPAWRALRGDAETSALRAVGSRAGAVGRTPAMRALVIVQIAASLVLLTGALVLVGAVWRLTRVQVGFGAPDVVTYRLTIPASLYASTAQRLALMSRVMDEVRAVPGVSAAGVSNDLPFADGDPRIRFFPEGTASSQARDAASARWRIAVGDYFRLLGLRRVDGRPLDPSDGPSAPPVVVVNETLASEYFADGRAVGQYLRLEDNIRRQIVGVMADIKEASLWDRPLATIYYPAPQLRLYDPFPLPVMWMSRPYILAASAGAGRSVRTSVKEAVERIDRNLVVDDASTMDERVTRSISGMRFAASVTSVFGLLALCTAVAGLYGLLAYWVARRMSEFGIRLALGATPDDLIRLVLRDGMLTMSVGIGLGLVAAWQVAHLAKSIAYGVGEPQVLSLAAAAGVLGTAGLLACWRPARSAARAEPLRMLRMD
jgi:predicted permease